MNKSNQTVMFRTEEPITLETIEREDGTKVEMFKGYAITFGEKSRLLRDFQTGQPCHEIIERGAVTQEMLNNCDIICTTFHNRENMLARCDKGQGSMILRVDDRGVLCMFPFDPSSPHHCNTASSVRRGDMKGMSFMAFIPTIESYATKGNDGIMERHITKMPDVFEVTIAANPAYPSTTATSFYRECDMTQAELEALKRHEEEEANKHLLARQMREVEAAQARRAQALREIDF